MVIAALYFLLERTSRCDPSYLNYCFILFFLLEGNHAQRECTYLSCTCLPLYRNFSYAAGQRCELCKAETLALEEGYFDWIEINQCSLEFLSTFIVVS